MYKGYLIDLDGTIYLGDEIIPAGKRFVERLQEEKIPFLFVTNNSSRTPEEVVRMLATKFSIQVTTDHVYTSAQATADYMDRLGKEKTVYWIGHEGIKQSLSAHGYSYEEKNPAFVVVGLDRELTYQKLSTASLAIQKGATFIGTNPDRNIPTHEGLMPSAGPSIAYLETATGQKATVIGKPEAIMMEGAVQRLGLDKKEVAMVGDNYETDILAGIHNDIPSILVLTGFTKKEQVPTLPEQPTHVLNSLDEWKL